MLFQKSPPLFSLQTLGTFFLSGFHKFWFLVPQNLFYVTHICFYSTLYVWFLNNCIHKTVSSRHLRGKLHHKSLPFHVYFILKFWHQTLLSYIKGHFSILDFHWLDKVKALSWKVYSGTLNRDAGEKKSNPGLSGALKSSSLVWENHCAVPWVCAIFHGQHRGSKSTWGLGKAAKAVWFYRTSPPITFPLFRLS